MVMLPGVALPMTLTDSYSIGVVEAALFSNHKQLVVATIRPEIQRRFEKEKKVVINCDRLFINESSGTYRYCNERGN